MKIIFKLEIAINKKNQKTLLITGAAGYIGNSISERCAKDNINIVLVDKDKKSVFLSSENLKKNIILKLCQYQLIYLVKKVFLS